MKRGRRQVAALGSCAVGLAVGLVTGCSGTTPAGPDAALASALTAPVPGVSLPPDELLPLVPTPGEVPAGLVPLLSASGPRDRSAIAAFSADPAAAVADLTAHGFKHAYVAQYAEAGGARVVSVVVVRFGDEAGAVADLTGDLAAGSGEVLALPLVGDAPVGAQARRQPLPGQAGGELVTVRFRRGATTWLLAYGDRPSADPQVALRLARLLTDRTT